MSARRMLTTLIVFVVGLVVGPFLTPSPNNQPATTVSERANLAKATAFYVAANHFLNDGDDAPLLEMLDATFVDHSPLDTEPTATGLVRYLASLRATYPDMRLEANAIVARDDMVTIALATTEATTAIVDGPVPDRTSSIPGIERLRMQNGRVVERWASESLPSQYEQVASLEVLQPAGWFVFCVMERLEFEPGASMARRDSSDSLLIVDAGALSIEVDGGGEGEPRLLLPHGQIGDSVLQRGVPGELETESVVLLPAAEAYRIWNERDETVVALRVEIQMRSPSATFVSGSVSQVESDQDVAESTQIGMLLTESNDARPYQLRLIRWLAAPNDLAPAHLVLGIEQMLVSGGALEASIFSGNVSVLTRDGAQSELREQSRVMLPAEGLTARWESLVSYQATNKAPSAIWLVSLVPIQHAGR